MGRRPKRDWAQAAEQQQDISLGWATLLAGLIITAFLFWKNGQPMDFAQYYLLNTALLLGAPLVLLLLFLKRDAAEFGMTPGDVRGGLVAAGVLFLLFCPVIFIVAGWRDSQTYYLGHMRASGALVGAQFVWGGFLYHQTVLAFYMLAWEWYSRGFLLFGLKRLLPLWGAVLFQACAFALLHYRKPWPETVSSFFGALVMAYIAIRFRSFLPCFVLHFLISLAFDLAVLYHFAR